MGDTREITIMMSQVANQRDFSAILFIISSKQDRIKRLNLDPKLTAGQRTEKLQKWSKENRFVKVIHAGDQIFAKVHQDHAKKELTLEGKKVSLESLNDEEYEKDVLQDLFEESIQEEPKAKSHPLELFSSGIRQFLAPKMLISDQMQAQNILTSIRSFISQMTLNCVRLWNEARRKDEAEKKEDEKRQDIAGERIKKEVIKTGIQKTEVTRDATRVANIHSRRL